MLGGGAPASEHCSSCGAGVSPASIYCSHCGARIERGPGRPDDSTPVCGNCGSTVDLHGAFCWKCGVPLETGTAPFMPSTVLDRPGMQTAPVGALTPGFASPSQRAKSINSESPSLPGGSNDRPPPTSSAGQGFITSTLASILVVVAVAAGIGTGWTIAAGYYSAEPPSSSAETYLTIDSVHLNITYAPGEKPWLSGSNANQCLQVVCPFLLQTFNPGGSLDGVEIYVFSNYTGGFIHQYNVTSVNLPFKMTGPIPEISIIGLNEAAVLIEVPATYGQADLSIYFGVSA